MPDGQPTGQPDTAPIDGGHVERRNPVDGSLVRKPPRADMPSVLESVRRATGITVRDPDALTQRMADRPATAASNDSHLRHAPKALPGAYRHAARKAAARAGARLVE